MDGVQNRCATRPTSNAATSPFSTQPSGSWPIVVFRVASSAHAAPFFALVARQTRSAGGEKWAGRALRSRLRKQPTNLWRHHCSQTWEEAQHPGSVCSNPIFLPEPPPGRLHSAKISRALWLVRFSGYLVLLKIIFYEAIVMI